MCDRTVCTVCRRKLVANRFAVGYDICFDCRGLCTACQNPIGSCVCLTKQKKYKLSIENLPFYSRRSESGLVGNIVGALFKMHHNGALHSKALECIKEAERWELFALIENMEAELVMNLATNEPDLLREQRTLFDSTLVDLVYCPKIFKTIFEAVQIGHPSVASFKVVLLTSKVSCAKQQLHIDFPKYCERSNVKFPMCPFSLLIALEVNKNPTQVAVAEYNRMGILCEKLITVRKGEGLLIRGDLLHGDVEHSQANRILYFSFGTCDFPVDDATIRVLDVEDRKAK